MYLIINIYYGMISTKHVTIIVPVFRIENNRLKNLMFILPYLIKTGCRVLVVEQSNKSKSSLAAEVVAQGGEHLIFPSNSETFHKTGIINWATRNHVTTKYVWVNDADFYMKFSIALKKMKPGLFIRPYDVCKKLSEKERAVLLKGEQLEVSYNGKDGEYVGFYGAMAFVFNRKEFIKIGGMDETIFGWGKEDIEFERRVRSLKYEISVVDEDGIHLWHPVKPPTITLNDRHFEGKDLAVVTCHFNWANFTTPVRNLNRFINQMAIEGVPLYGIELSLTDKFETEGLKNWRQMKVTKENVCFQKEAVINILEKTVPKRFTKIAWIDHDLLFSNRNWYAETSKKLDEYKVLQLFSNYASTTKTGKITKIIPSIMAAGGPGENNKTNGTHAGQPGGAWAARREMWRHGGLYSLPLMGGGDTAFIYSIFNVLTDEKILQSIGLKDGVEFKPFAKWRKKLVKYVNKSVSYVPGTIVHEWHGDMNKRNYGRRYELMEQIDFNKSVSLDKRGLVKITKVEPSFYNGMMKYFVDRAEDGNDVILAKKAVYKEAVKHFTAKDNSL